MAYVICICGAGGKTTLCYEIAHKYANQNKKICVMTTTHMWHNVDISYVKEINYFESGKIYTFGNIKGDMIVPVDDDEYNIICEKFDYVIIEADGSKCMPFKIPDSTKEPVIPINVNEIIIVWNKCVIGRKIKNVCFRYEEFKEDIYMKGNHIIDDTIVTEDIIEKIYNHYYVEYLQKKYRNVKISTYKVEMSLSKNYENYKKVLFALLASGESKRFGEKNKLLMEVKDKPLYKIVFDKILISRKLLIDKFCSLKKDIGVDIIVTTSHDEIFYDKYTNGNAKLIMNTNYKNGISSSIKTIIDYAIKENTYDAVVFFNADMPYLEENEIMHMIYDTMCSNYKIGAMTSEVCKTPAFFSRKYYNDLMMLDGDVGAKVLFDKYKSVIYRYFVDDNILSDIDTIEDYDSLVKVYE